MGSCGKQSTVTRLVSSNSSGSRRTRHPKGPQGNQNEVELEEDFPFDDPLPEDRGVVIQVGAKHQAKLPALRERPYVEESSARNGWGLYMWTPVFGGHIEEYRTWSEEESARFCEALSGNKHKFWGIAEHVQTRTEIECVQYYYALKGQNMQKYSKTKQPRKLLRAIEEAKEAARKAEKAARKAEKEAAREAAREVKRANQNRPIQPQTPNPHGTRGNVRRAAEPAAAGGAANAPAGEAAHAVAGEAAPAAAGAAEPATAGAAETAAAGEAANAAAGEAANAAAGEAAHAAAGEAEPAAAGEAEPVAARTAEPVAARAAEPVAAGEAEPTAAREAAPAAAREAADTGACQPPHGLGSTYRVEEEMVTGEEPRDRSATTQGASTTQQNVPTLASSSNVCTPQDISRQAVHILPFPCVFQGCCKSYSTNRSLQSHMNMHKAGTKSGTQTKSKKKKSGQRPSKSGANGCTGGQSSEGQGSVGDQLTEAVFPCVQCERVFAKIKSRNAHMKYHKRALTAS